MTSMPMVRKALDDAGKRDDAIDYRHADLSGVDRRLPFELSEDVVLQLLISFHGAISKGFELPILNLRDMRFRSIGNRAMFHLR